MLVAASPSWFADNVAIIALVVLVVVTFFVLRLVKAAVTKGLLLAVLAGVALLVYVNRGALETCARDCECELANRDVQVPFCDPKLDLTAGVPSAGPHA